MSTPTDRNILLLDKTMKAQEPTLGHNRDILRPSSHFPSQNDVKWFNCLAQKNSSNTFHGPQSSTIADVVISEKEDQLLHATPSLYLLLQTANPILYRKVITPSPVVNTLQSPESTVDSYQVASDVQLLFDCANSLHIQRIGNLHTQLSECACQLRQTKSHLEASQREVNRLQDENTRLERRAHSQAARYEDQLIELHTVIAELRHRRGQEPVETVACSSAVPSRPAAAVDTDDQCVWPSVPAKRDHPSCRQAVCDLVAHSIDEEVSSSSCGDDFSVDAVDGDHVENQMAGVYGEDGKDDLERPLVGGYASATAAAAPFTRPGSADRLPLATQQTTLEHCFSPASSRARPADIMIRSSSAELVMPPPVVACVVPTPQVSSTLALADTYCSVTNLYDVPEPSWVTLVLEDYHKVTTNTNTESMGLLSSASLQTLLTGLTQCSPFPRLSEATRCGQLVLERLLASLGRLRADCLLLQANLIEAKTNADHQQCRLNQIESHWSALWRAFQLADASLEVTDSLNQLHSSELAMLVYREARKLSRRRGNLSTMSSSTSSSSCAATTPRRRGWPTGVGETSSSLPTHVYAAYANPSDVGSVANASANNAGPNALTMHTLRVLRHQAEVSAHCLLQRYEALLEQSGVSSHPATGGFLLSRLHRTGQPAATGAPLSPGLLSTNSQTTQITSSLSRTTGTMHNIIINSNSNSNPGSSVCGAYANSWYASLTRPVEPGKPGIVTAGRPTTSTSASTNSISSLPTIGNAQASGLCRLLPGPPRPTGHTQPACGWQTPDSGAGSSSTTNDAAATGQQTGSLLAGLLSMPCSPPAGVLCETYPVVLDLLPPVWCLRAGQRSVMSATDSSDSSDSEADTSVHPAVAVPTSRGSTTTNETGLTTYRPEELRLRTVLHQLILACRMVRASIPEHLGESGEYAGHRGQTARHEQQKEPRCETDSAYMYTSIVGADAGGQPKPPLPTSSPGALGCLPLSVLLENTVLLQENCTVKEERADLKARLYLLEKELQANRLSLESRTVAELAVRAHLAAVQAELDRQVSTVLAPGYAGPTTPVQQQQRHDSELIRLRTQVKDLLQAFESLRHNLQIQQMHNEELVDDLKRANTALITAFEKAKRKYLARIHKLETHLSTRTAEPSASQPALSTPTPTQPLTSTGNPTVVTQWRLVTTVQSQTRGCELYLPPPPPTAPPPPPGAGGETSGRFVSRPSSGHPHHQLQPGKPATRPKAAQSQGRIPPLGGQAMPPAERRHRIAPTAANL